MPKICTSTHVNAPIEKVFAKFADFAGAAEIVDGIERVEMLTEGPVSKGTRFNETRKMFGKETTEEMEVSTFEPNKRYTVSADSCGAHFDTTFRFTSADGGTQVDMETVIRPITIFAKLFSPVSLLMKNSMKKMIQKDIDNVKAHCERVA